MRLSSSFRRNRRYLTRYKEIWFAALLSKNSSFSYLRAGQSARSQLGELGRAWTSFRLKPGAFYYQGQPPTTTTTGIAK
jgi:hypothetical protein